MLPEMLRRMSVVLLVLLVSSERETLCHKNARDKQNFEQDLLKSVTSFRPMRRYLSNFIPGRTAKLILTFQGRKSPQIRWFVGIGSNYSLPFAEIPNKINIDGNHKYSVKSLSSHDITVVTLRIHKLENKFPIEITTCFNYKYALFQYQLYTSIPSAVDYDMEMLDAVMWLGTPPYTIAYSLSGNITISCEARFESDSTGFIDEVHIYRTSLDNDRPVKGLNDQLVSLGCGKMHRGRAAFVERTGKYTYTGGQKMETNRYGAKHRILKMTFTITNGSTSDSGVYTCMAERGSDKTFSSTWIRQRDLRAPTMIFSPCEDTQIKRESPRQDGFFPGLSRTRKPVFVINITRYQPTCVRCRAFDYLTSQIMLERDGQNFTSSTDSVILDNHVNVPDGALSELTITFLRPTEKDAGSFRCSVTDDSGSDHVNFRVQVVNRRS